MTTHSDSSFSGRGLVNLGNTCYFNSTVQCLAKTRPLRKSLKLLLSNNGQEEKTECKEINLTRELVTVLKGVSSASSINRNEINNLKSKNKNNRNAFDPSKLLQQLRKVSPQFKGNSQHDAHECLISILCECDEELKKLGSDNQDDSDDNWEENEIETRNAHNQFHDCFSGTFGLLLWNIIKCDKCQYQYMIEEQTMGLSLTLPGVSPSNMTNHRNYSKILKQRHHSTVTKKAKLALKKAEKAEKKKKKDKAEAEDVAKLNEWLTMTSSKSVKGKSAKKLKQEEKALKRNKKLASRKGTPLLTLGITSTVENITTESVSTDEKVLTESVSTDEKVTTEIVSTDEKVTTEIVSTDEKVTTESVSTDEKVTTESVSTDEKVPTESVSTDEKVTTESVSTDEKVTTESVSTDEKVTTESVSTDEKVTTENESVEEAQIRKTEEDLLIEEGWLRLNDKDRAQRIKLSNTTLASPPLKSIGSDSIHLNDCLNHFLTPEVLSVSQNNGFHCPCCEAKERKRRFLESRDFAPKNSPNEQRTAQDVKNNECYTTDDEAEDDGDCWEHKEENDEGEESSHIAELSNGTHQIVIAEPPKVLCLHLKRLLSFHKLTNHVQAPEILHLNSLGQLRKASTNQSTIDHKLEEEVGKYVYDLYGMIEHIGKSQGGHYVAYTQTNQLEMEEQFSTHSSTCDQAASERSRETFVKKWNRISDLDVTQVSNETVHNVQAYILFYALRE